MMNLATLILIAVMAAPPEPGRYTNVRHIPEADDYVGLNLDIPAGANPTVRYELCEGWCNGAKSYPARQAGDVLAFTVHDEVFDGSGKPAQPWVYRVEVRSKRTLLGPRLIVTSPDLEDFREVLRPR